MEESELLRLLQRGDPAGLEALIVRYTPYVSAVAARILPGCSGASDMSPSNREEFAGDRQELLDQGYTPCGICKP